MILLLLLVAAPSHAQELEGGVEARPPQPANFRNRDPFQPFRHSDGTIDWERVNDPSIPVDQRRLKSFSLEYFVQELAIVAATGDKTRLREFFSGVTATDFYKNYGLFLVGGTAAELGYDMAYRRFLHRHLKVHFVSGVLRSNITLATGLALAQIVTGKFDGKVFAISMGSLGLSSSVVSAALSRLPFVRKLHTASMAVKATRMLKVGGFVYQSAELALIFFVGRQIENAYYKWKDKSEAKKALTDAGRRCLEALKRATKRADAESALLAYSAAWDDYRAFLYRPLLALRAKLLRSLDGIAQRSKIGSDRVKALRKRVERFQNLPLSFAAERTQVRSDAEIAKDMQQIAEDYTKTWQKEFDAIYTERRRPGKFVLGQSAKPSEGFFLRAHLRVSGNRLQTYEDQREALAYLQGLLPARYTHTLQAALNRADSIRLADKRLYESDLGLLELGTRVQDHPPSQGATKALEAATKESATPKAESEQPKRPKAP
jgi:hypothetical protein